MHEESFCIYNLVLVSSCYKSRGKCAFEGFWNDFLVIEVHFLLLNSFCIIIIIWCLLLHCRSTKEKKEERKEKEKDSHRSLVTTWRQLQRIFLLTFCLHFDLHCDLKTDLRISFVFSFHSDWSLCPSLCPFVAPSLCLYINQSVTALKIFAIVFFPEQRILVEWGDRLPLSHSLVFIHFFSSFHFSFFPSSCRIFRLWIWRS